jgi:hypothetical protein
MALRGYGDKYAAKFSEIACFGQLFVGSETVVSLGFER